MGTSCVRETPTCLGKGSLQDVQLMLRSQMYYLETEICCTCSVRAKKTKLNSGMLKIQIQNIMDKGIHAFHYKQARGSSLLNCQQVYLQYLFMNIARLIRPVNSNRKHFKYLTRLDIAQRNHSKGHHKYTLKAVLRPTFTLFQLYHLHFPSPTQHPKADTPNNPPLSIFYQLFIQYCYLHSLLSTVAMKGQRVHLSLQTIFGSRDIDRDSSDGGVWKMTKQLLERLAEKHRGKSLLKEESIVYEQIKLILTSIDQLLDSFILETSVNCDKILLMEILPNFVDSNSLTLYVSNCFDKIKSIQILDCGARLKMIDLMIKQLSPIMTVSYQEEYVEIKELRRNNQERRTLLQHNLTFQRFTLEQQPVVTTLGNYFVFRRRERDKSTTLQTLNHCSRHLVRQLFQTCQHFHQKTRSVFPFISVEDIHFDQKALTPVLNQIGLLYHGLGVRRKGNGSIEAQLASSGTPKPLQFEKSPWEFGRDEQWALCQHYFRLSVRQRELSQYEWNQGCPVNPQQIAENSHVWRLLCIFYQIMNDGSHLTNVLYNQQAASGQEALLPFRLTQYKILLKDIERQFIAKPSKILDLLQWEQPRQPQTQEEFSFKIKQLEGLLALGIYEEELKEEELFKQVEGQLWVHEALCRQITNTYLNQNIFKQVLNAKKYVLVLSVSGMQVAFELGMCVWNSAKSSHIRRKILTKLKDCQRFDFEKDRNIKRMFISESHSKLMNYLTRSDEQYNYLSNHSPFVPKIKLIWTLYENLRGLDKKLDQLEENVQLEFDFMEKRKMQEQFCKKWEEMEVGIMQMYNTGSEVVEEMLREEFQGGEHHLSRLDRLSEKVGQFHRFENQQQQSNCNYFTKRFYLLVRAFLSVAPANWRKYQTFVIPDLIDVDRTSIHAGERRAEQLSSRQLEKVFDQLEYVFQIVKEQPVFLIKTEGQMMSSL